MSQAPRNARMMLKPQQVVTALRIKIKHVRLSLLSVLEISIKHYTLYNKYIYSIVYIFISIIKDKSSDNIFMSYCLLLCLYHIYKFYKQLSF